MITDEIVIEKETLEQRSDSNYLGFDTEYYWEKSIEIKTKKLRHICHTIY